MLLLRVFYTFLFHTRFNGYTTTAQSTGIRFRISFTPDAVFVLPYICEMGLDNGTFSIPDIMIILPEISKLGLDGGISFIPDAKFIQP
jgi:hypothetical protein